MDRDFALRIGTACVMAPAGVWAIYSGGQILFWATTACAVIGAFEWSRMALRPDQAILRPVLTGVLAAGAAGATANAGSPTMVGLVALITAILALIAALIARRRPLSIAFGGIYLTLPFAAFIGIREVTPDGRWILLSVLAIVAMTDIAGYLAGRGFGGPLLAPRGSPNKTWTGATGALLCGGLTGAVCGRVLDGPLLHWIAAGVVLSIVSQAGDLLESTFKRRFGVKDASGVIPGHGGVLDRLDGLMAASLFTGLVLWLVPSLAPHIGAG